MSNWNEQASNNPKFTGSEVAPSLLASLEWRAIGPYRGGRVVAVAGDPVDPQVFYFDSTGGGVWKTTDGGQYWENISDGFFNRASVGAIAVAESDPNVIYVGMGEATIRGNVSHGDEVYKSIDGGGTFTQISVPHGDYHDLWIDPRDPLRMICGHDGGACVTESGAESWSSIYNQPTGEYYHVITDNQVPYRVYGSQQDNTTITLPSRSSLGAITLADYYEIGGCESGYIAVRPDDPTIVYAGCYQG